MEIDPTFIVPAEVNVNVRVLPVLPALTVPGETVQVPDPSAALTVTNGLDPISFKVPPLVALDLVVNVAVPALLCAVAPEVPPPLPYTTVMILLLGIVVIGTVTVCPEKVAVPIVSLEVAVVYPAVPLLP